MREKLKEFAKNSSVKNSAILMVGTGISQIIPVLFSPFLARIYSPGSFGDLAIFVAISVISAIIATGLYEYAIVLPKEDTDALHIVCIIVILAVVFSLISLVSILILRSFKEINTFYLYLPFSIFCTVTFNILSSWYNRYKLYKQLNVLRIMQTVLIVGGSFFFYKNTNGLIYGYLLGGIFSLLIFFILFVNKLKDINVDLLKTNAIEYKKFPLVIMPSSVINTFSSYAPVFFIKNYFSSHTLGSYSMSARVLTAPVSVISTAIGQVYFKNISDYHNEDKEQLLKKHFFSTLKILSFLSLLIFLPLFFLGEDLMLLVFGSKWGEAGKYVEIIALSSMIKFIVSPLSMLLIVKKQLNKVARWQTMYFFTTITIFFIGSFYSITNLLWFYVIHETILYVIYYFIIYSSFDKVNK